MAVTNAEAHEPFAYSLGSYSNKTGKNWSSSNISSPIPIIGSLPGPSWRQWGASNSTSHGTNLRPARISVFLIDLTKTLHQKTYYERRKSEAEPNFNAVEEHNIWLIRKIERINGGAYSG
ncbi:hypothetical protein N9L71_05290 [Verrucomicrobiales bacterium]|nr:hypothetical protein [Verrucomicrobiales bacterium]